MIFIFSFTTVKINVPMCLQCANSKPHTSKMPYLPHPTPLKTQFCCFNLSMTMSQTLVHCLILLLVHHILPPLLLFLGIYNVLLCQGFVIFWHFLASFLFLHIHRWMRSSSIYLHSGFLCSPSIKMQQMSRCHPSSQLHAIPLFTCTIPLYPLNCCCILGCIHFEAIELSTLVNIGVHIFSN